MQLIGENSNIVNQHIILHNYTLHDNLYSEFMIINNFVNSDLWCRTKH